MAKSDNTAGVAADAASPITMWDGQLTDRQMVEETQRFARSFRCVIEIAERVKSAEDMNNLVGESKNRLVAAQKEETEQYERVAKVKAVADEHEERGRIAQEKADGLVEAAGDEAKKIVEDARAEGMAAVETAHTEAEAVKAAAAEEVEVIKIDITNMTQTRADLETEIAEKTKQLIKVNSDVANAKGVITKMLNQQSEG